MDTEAAQTLLRPGGARDRLTAGIFISEDPRYRQGQIERAFAQSAKAEPIENTLRAARRAGLLRSTTPEGRIAEAVAEGIITESDAQDLARMAELRREVIMVDAFAQYGKQHLLNERGSTKPAIYAV